MFIVILILSLLMGLSFLVGLFLSYKFKSKKMTYFATGLAFMIILAVLFTDIIPEIFEAVTNVQQLGLSISSTVLGVLTLVFIELFIPHHSHSHEHNDEAKSEHKKHLYHIGLLTFISVVIHNILEGIAFAILAKTSIKAALLMAGGIALHNIPLGIEMSYFFKNYKDKYLHKNLTLILSGTLGAAIGLIIGGLNSSINFIILSITCGMMLYSGIFELGI